MLTMNDVIREGHKTLTLKAKEVNIPLSKTDKKTLKEMMEFLENSQNDEVALEYDLRPGVGLAAPQINISKRMIAILSMDEDNEIEHKLIMVNPKIISHSIQKTYLDCGEGCLSVDRDVEGFVLRHKKITIKSHLYNVENDTLSLETFRVTGYIAVVIQHEIDHLDGILFVDKLVEDVGDAICVKFKTIELEEDEIKGLKI